ncbi:hypothetical protein TL16_g01819 [Triparma laevis f. inornata]|uniref:Uncharacterized protein n=1 Tax=Triparma laevis f. inornata TaxID=1714386 RepID=A0A9W6ZRB9_9STRA|nr:hypothetical protein TL16_g01819 [Triparma laevis f. inornata]
MLSSVGSSGLPRATGAVIGLHVVAGVWIIVWGLASVGGKRKYYMEKARKDGEKDVDSRYALPNLYVSGNTIHSKAFNCAQRSHQQVFETYTQFTVANLAGAICFPCTALLSASVWFLGRVTWSKGYASSEGDAKKRYTSPFSYGIWTGLLSSSILGLMSAAKIALA